MDDFWMHIINNLPTCALAIGLIVACEVGNVIFARHHKQHKNRL